jgi:DNA-binding MarR family transcriptional regulator
MAEEMFELSKLASALRSRRPGGTVDLTESEFLTLDQIIKHESLTIGEIQRSIGVVPAQMSRIIRGLENRASGGYITCSINPHDRRRIDVQLSEAGRQAYQAYRTSRTASMLDSLASLPHADRLHFMRIARMMRTAMEAQLASDNPQ